VSVYFIYRETQHITDASLRLLHKSWSISGLPLGIEQPRITKYLEDITGVHVNSECLRVYTEHLKDQSSFILGKKCEISATKAGPLFYGMILIASLDKT
jgi:hypothetical protein